jgi:hypothetical protein
METGRFVSYVVTWLLLTYFAVALVDQLGQDVGYGIKDGSLYKCHSQG